MTNQEQYLWSTVEDDLLVDMIADGGVVYARKEVLRRLAMLDQLLNHDHDDSGECSDCGIIVCPFSEPLHFHHDGCPACVAFEGKSK